MKVEVIPKAEEINQYDLKGSELVAIDVLRATSVMVTAFENGANEIIPVLDIEDAFAIKKNNKSAILGGERGGLKIPGFDLGNSPQEYTSKRIYNKTIVMTTTNGTRLIQNSLSADYIYIGSLLNAQAVAERLHKDKVVIACSGTKGYFSPEDFLGAGAIIHSLKRNKTAICLEEKAQKALQLFNLVNNRTEFLRLFPHGRLLVERGFESDLDYCLEVNKVQVVPQYFCGVLKI